jgi:hypothetical protein
MRGGLRRRSAVASPPREEVMRYRSVVLPVDDVPLVPVVDAGELVEVDADAGDADDAAAAPAGFVPTYLISFNASACVGSSSLPAGISARCRITAMMSATCGRLKLPGLSAGIVTRMRSERSLSDRSLQFALNSLPTSAGASLPVSSEPWQFAHFSA